MARGPRPGATADLALRACALLLGLPEIEVVAGDCQWVTVQVGREGRTVEDVAYQLGL
jgi:hypothetical protein